jgi:hypothetical protein
VAGNRVAVAISGGGYRASAWGLGVLWALVDAGVNADVSMVASVSGGSITNAQVGQGPDYCSISSDEFANRATPYAERLVGRPAAWLGALVVTMLGWLAAWLLIALERPGVVPVAVAISLVASVVGAATSGDLVFNRIELWLYIHLLLGLVALVVWASGVIPVFGSVLLLGTVALARGPVVGWCLGRSLRTLSPGRDDSLGGLNAEPLHVFLATELRAGHHAAFARDFVYCFDLGLGAKPALPVRVAVQASSNLPGAFPTRWVRTAGMNLRGGDHSAGWMALSDGGDYDNMGDQWPLGLVDRIERLSGSEDIVNHPPAMAVLQDWRARMGTFVIVANASGALGYRRVWKGVLPVLGELLGLLQVKDVLYDNGNSVRRQRLIEWFDAGTPAGTLVHISSSPYTLAKGWSDRDRAQAAIAWLDSHMTEAEWNQQVTVARAVGTQFWPLGRAKTRAVVRAAYAQTMAHLHLKLGTPFHQLPNV